MRAKQLSFFGKLSSEHGGQLRQGRRKIARPLDPKRPVHIVLRSSHARGKWSLLRPTHEIRVRDIVDAAARKYSVRVHRLANVGNHLHLLVKTRTRKGFQGFLREITGRIASMITGSRKAHPMGEIAGTTRFWDFLAYTRIVEWGRDFRNLELYFIKNLFEAAGLFPQAAKAAGLKMIPLGRRE